MAKTFWETSPNNILEEFFSIWLSKFYAIFTRLVHRASGFWHRLQVDNQTSDLYIECALICSVWLGLVKICMHVSLLFEIWHFNPHVQSTSSQNKTDIIKGRLCEMEPRSCKYPLYVLLTMLPSVHCTIILTWRHRLDYTNIFWETITNESEWVIVV